MTTFVTRAGWGARPPDCSSSLSAVGDRIHYNGPALNLSDHSRCAATVRGIQAFHMDSRGWCDIAYSMLVCPHDCVYEGRGKGKRTAANGTTICNSKYDAVMVMIGDGQAFTDPMKRGVLWALDYLGHDLPGDIGPHSSCKATSCPGNPIRAWITAGLPGPGGGSIPAPITWKEVGIVKRTYVQIPMDATGNGWRDLGVMGTPIAAVAHVPDPPAGGYWKAHAEIAKDTPDGTLVVVVTDAPAGAEVGVWITYEPA